MKSFKVYPEIGDVVGTALITPNGYMGHIRVGVEKTEQGLRVILPLRSACMELYVDGLPLKYVREKKKAT